MHILNYKALLDVLHMLISEISLDNSTSRSKDTSGIGYFYVDKQEHRVNLFTTYHEEGLNLFTYDFDLPRF